MATWLLKGLFFTALTLLAAWLFWRELSRRLAALRRARGPLPRDRPERRWARVLREVLFQTKVIRHRPLPGLAHALLVWAFGAYFLETLDHLSRIWQPRGFLPDQGLFHVLFHGLVAVFAWAAAAGIIVLAVRRFVQRPVELGRNLSWSSGAVALFILLLMLTYLARHHGWVPDQGPRAELNWSLHTIVLLAFLVLIPRSKHLHLVLGPFAVFHRNETPGELAPLDFEREEMGVDTLAGLGQANALALFACVECGRCMEHCPATQSGKALDPKELVLRMRDGFLTDPEQPAVGPQVPEDWLWQCTTCGACAEQCPTGNDQPLSILEFRRGLTSEGRFPDTLRTLFDNLERSGNPWRHAAVDASAFLREAGIPLHDGSQKVLYWMGCMARYDEAYRRVALDFVAILRAAGVDFAVLKDEKCTGDAARRAGNEFLFQQLAMENAALINEAAPDLIVSTCPHCIRSLDEYKSLPDEMRLLDRPILHHSQFIRQLIEQGRLPLSTTHGAPVQDLAYHDPCYLSRYVDEGVDAPREVLRGAGVRVREAERHGRRSFCCGAGGAQLFMEEREGRRINHIRTEELLDTGAGTVCVSCPFCRTMIKDGMTDKGRGDLPVLDLAQVVARSLGKAADV
ncbi:MAG: (Fe-S)-binding protein [bacterium]|nr:(Fe-S)-binding protein [bacterium]